MKRKVAAAAVIIVASSVAGLVASPEAPAAPTVGGREWNELWPTTGLTWTQVASVCPTDGVTPCQGSVGGRNLSGWVWATAPQVLELFERYAPGISQADPPVDNSFAAGIGFLGEFRWTTYTALTYFYTEYAAGWTASKDATGLPISGGGSFQTPFFAGGIGLGATADVADATRGVFLWRTAGLDYSPPMVTPVVVGTLGTNGWYRSDVEVSWNVVDNESPIVAVDGCDRSTLVADSAGTSYTCTARSAGLGGTTVATTTVRRDATPPTVTCGPPPTFLLTQSPAVVTAAVSDTLSGPVATSVAVSVSTASAGVRQATVSGTDRAGNTTTTSCPFSVLVPTCKGRTATIVGTGAADTLYGTAKADVIIGLAGTDTIYGNGGNDVICGGDGSDALYGGGGADLIDGGAGDDNLFGGGGDDDLDGGVGSDSVRGDAGADRCTSGEIRMSSCATIV